MKKKSVNESAYVVFDSNDYTYFDYSLQKLQKWINVKKENECESADGKYEVNNHIINIIRNNSHGRLVFKLNKFMQNGMVNTFISSDIAKPYRNIEVEFEAKVSGEPIDIWTIFQPKDSFEWIAQDLNSVKSKEWNKFIVRKTINSNLDFIVRFEDANCKRLPCDYQIRNIFIREII